MNTTKDNLEINIVRDKSLLYQIEQCDDILDEIKKTSYRESALNVLLRKLKFKSRAFETKCIDGVHTDFDMDELFMNDLKKAVSDRKQRIESHAKKFMN